MTDREMKLRLKQDTKGDLIDKLIMAYMTIRDLQKEIDALKAKNSDVPCPACGGKTHHEGGGDRSGRPVYYPCSYCNKKGTVSTVKALQYRMKQLEDKLIEVLR